MKGIDVAIVRFLPFILYIIIGINTIACFNGVDMTLAYELHGNSALYALGLFIISLSNKKYHCVWNRVMYAYLIFIPFFNFMDSAIYIFPSDRAYMLTILISYILAAIITAYLAIRHFIQMTMKRYYARIRQQSNADNEGGGTSPQVRN